MGVYRRHLLVRWGHDFLLCFAILSSLMLVGNLVRIGMGLSLVLPLLPALLPSLLVYLLPMCALTATLTALSRARAEGEFVALAAGGICVRGAAPPLLLAGTALSLFTLASFEWIQPAAEDYQRRFLARQGAMLIEQQLELKQVVIRTAEATLFFFESGAGGRAAVIQQRREGRIVRELFAGDVRVDLDRERHTMALDLKHSWALSYAEGHKGDVLPAGELHLPIPYHERTPYERSARVLPLSELLRRLSGPVGEKERREIQAVLHEKLAFVASPLLFVLAAFPLAFSGGRAGRFTGFILGLLLVFAVYYPLLVLAKKQALLGNVPAELLLQLPNLVMLGIAALGWPLIERRV